MHNKWLIDFDENKESKVIFEDNWTELAEGVGNVIMIRI
jgi:hypothetical protein